jgi:uncharacterized membrane protein
MNKLRDLIIDGILLALPLGAAAYLLRKVVHLLMAMLGPVLHFAPDAHWYGIAALEIAALLALLLLLLLLGLFARSAPGRKLGATLEQLVLSKIPGYMIFKSIAADLGSTDREEEMRPALIAFDDNTVLGFVIEESEIRTDDGLITVFIPGAPTAAQGSVVIVPRSRVKLLDVGMGSARKVMKQRGAGLLALLEPQTKR